MGNSGSVDSKAFESLYRKGTVCHKNKDFEPALEFFEACLKDEKLLRENQRARAYTAMGAANFSLGRLKSAIDCYTSCITIENVARYPKAHHGRGQARNRAGFFQGAIEDFSNAIMIGKSEIDGVDNETLARFYVDRAKTQKSLKNVQAAIDDMSEAIKLIPHRPDYFQARANHYWDTERFDMARRDFQRAVDLCVEGSEEHTVARRWVHWCMREAEKKAVSSTWDSLAIPSSTNSAGSYRSHSRGSPDGSVDNYREPVRLARTGANSVRSAASFVSLASLDSYPGSVHTVRSTHTDIYRNRSPTVPKERRRSRSLDAETARQIIEQAHAMHGDEYLPPRAALSSHELGRMMTPKSMSQDAYAHHRNLTVPVNPGRAKSSRRPKSVHRKKSKKKVVRGSRSKPTSRSSSKTRSSRRTVNSARRMRGPATPAWK